MMVKPAFSIFRSQKYRGKVSLVVAIIRHRSFIIFVFRFRLSAAYILFNAACKLEQKIATAAVLIHVKILSFYFSLFIKQDCFLLIFNCLMQYIRHLFLVSYRQSRRGL